MLCPPSLHSPGLRPENRQPTTHHCAKGKRKIFPSRVAWEPAPGCQWLLSNYCSNSTTIQLLLTFNKIPSIIPHCTLNQPRPYGEKTGIPYQHGKKRNSALPNTTFLTRDSRWKNYGRDPYCCLFQHFSDLTSSEEYTSGIYRNKLGKNVFSRFLLESYLHIHLFFSPLLSAVTYQGLKRL